MSGRAPFFVQVDEVIAILHEWPNGAPSKEQFDRTLNQELDLLKIQAERWEPLVQQLVSYDPAVLRYVAQQCKSREGQITRYVQATIGPSRGNGIVGILVSAFALAGVWQFLRGIFFEESVGRIIAGIGFLASFTFVLRLGIGIIRDSHPSGQLLMVADLLEATANLHESMGEWQHKQHTIPPETQATTRP